MTREHMQTSINWLGKTYRVDINWENEGGEVVFIRCAINGRELARCLHGRWKGYDGRRLPAREFSRLVKCCRENFRHPRYTNSAVTPLFTLLLGEDM